MTDDRQTRAQSQKQTRADRARKYDPTDAATDRQPEEPCMPDYANLSTAEVVRDFAVVRGDLSEQYARDQLTRAVDAKVAEAERRGAVKALREACRVFGGGDPERRSWSEALYCRDRADAIENGADL